MEAHLLAGLAHRELGDQRAANQATERALALAEADRLVLPFAMTGARELLEALPRHQTAAPRVSRRHPRRAARLIAGGQAGLGAAAEELSPGELGCCVICRQTCPGPQIARELSVSLNTVNTHLRSIYAKLQVRDRSAAVQRARELRLLATGRAPR